MFSRHSDAGDGSDFTLAFEDAQVIPPFSREKTVDTDDTDDTDDTGDTDNTDKTDVTDDKVYTDNTDANSLHRLK